MAVNGQIMNEFLRSALWYADYGWSLFPCRPGKKKPITGSGFKAATTDEDQIRKWWEKYPDPNIGIALGEDFDGHVVLGLRGAGSVELFLAAREDLPGSVLQIEDKGRKYLVDISTK